MQCFVTLLIRLLPFHFVGVRQSSRIDLYEKTLCLIPTKWNGKSHYFNLALKLLLTRLKILLIPFEKWIKDNFGPFFQFISFKLFIILYIYILCNYSNSKSWEYSFLDLLSYNVWIYWLLLAILKNIWFNILEKKFTFYSLDQHGLKTGKYGLMFNRIVISRCKFSLYLQYKDTFFKNN